MSFGARRLFHLALAVVAMGRSWCVRAVGGQADNPPAQAAGGVTQGHADPAADPPEPVQYMYDSGLANEWQDWGWSPRELKGGPAKVKFNDWGGWILARPGLNGDFGGVVFRVKVPVGEAEFLQLHLEGSNGNIFPKVNVSADQHTDVGEGWSQVYVPMAQLNPDGLPFERVVFTTFRAVDPNWILIDKVALTKGGAGPKPAASFDPAHLPPMTVSVDCRAKATKVNPMVFGIAYYAAFDAKRMESQWMLGATARRWGGNTATTYNYQIDAWNTGKDWFYENVPVPSYTAFLKDNEVHGVQSVLTVPIMGWVAKDPTSSSFPVSVVGAQQATDGYRPQAGNGLTPDGKPITSSPPRSFEPITPAFVKAWVEGIRREDAKTGKRSVQMYILDNEPALWSEIHRDAHPDPLTYDELVQRTIDFGTAVRQADPEAVIAGPAEWGWTGYMYSNKDQKAGLMIRPDRRAHGDMPLVAYYLKALAEHERKTGVRVLDVFDLHAYPYGDRIDSPAADREVSARRIRSTRGLWDPSYVDESWVKEPLKLLPRMHEWVDQNYPGRGISIGEWNYGGEDHISGGLAVAEVLGRYIQYGVTSAFYWAYPPANTPAMWAFRAYRDFDGKGGRFQDWYVPSKSGNDVSVFASRDEAGGHMVLVALNLSRDEAVAANFDLSSCGKVSGEQAYSYLGGPAGFVAGPRAGSAVAQALPPYSITVLDVNLTDPVAVAK